MTNLTPLSLEFVNEVSLNPYNFVRDYEQQKIVVSENGTLTLDPSVMGIIPGEHRDRYVSSFDAFLNSLIVRDPETNNYHVKVLTPIVVNCNRVVVEGNSRINLIRQALTLVPIETIVGYYQVADLDTIDASIVGFNLSIPIIREYRWRVLEAFYNELVLQGIAPDKASRKVLKQYQVPRNKKGEVPDIKKMSGTYIGWWQKRVHPVGSELFNLLDSEKISLKMYAIAVDKLAAIESNDAIVDEFIKHVELLDFKVTNTDHLYGILDKVVPKDIQSETQSQSDDDEVPQIDDDDQVPQIVIDDDIHEIQTEVPQSVIDVDDASLWEIPGIENFPDISDKLRFVRENNPGAVKTPQFNKLRLSIQTAISALAQLVAMASNE